MSNSHEFPLTQTRDAFYAAVDAMLMEPDQSTSLVRILAPSTLPLLMRRRVSVSYNSPSESGGLRGDHDGRRYVHARGVGQRPRTVNRRFTTASNQLSEPAAK